MKDQELHEAVLEVVKSWQRNGVLCRAASSGKLANVGKQTANVGKPKALNRKDIDINFDILAPIVSNFGD